MVRHHCFITLLWLILIKPDRVSLTEHLSSISLPCVSTIVLKNADLSLFLPHGGSAVLKVRRSELMTTLQL